MRWVRALNGGNRASSGLAGLDEILGGFGGGRLHLVEGRPGTGKTTLGMQFPMAGRDQPEKILFVSMSETRSDLDVIAGAQGWSLDGIENFELASPDAGEGGDKRRTMFRASEVELGEPLADFQDIMSGTPTYVGSQAILSWPRDENSP